MKITATDQNKIRSRLESIFDFGVRQLARMLPNWPSDKPAPIYTEQGIWARASDLWTDWCPGFYAGLMWLAAEYTGQPKWRAAAEEHTRALEHRKYDRGVHDLGFIFMSSADRWYRQLPEPGPEKEWLREMLVTAGTTQSCRWKETGEDHYIFSFNGPQSLFIDVIMNIRLLFRAYELGAGEEVYRKAVTHARTTEKYLVRKAGPRPADREGMTVHEAIFNPITGEFRNLSTQQGYSPFTCWSRGLAWAIYGFTDTYLFTRDQIFLDTAERCAAFYLNNTPDDGVPFWDYGAPMIPNEPRDSSAAAIAAGAFWKLKEVAGTRLGAATYAQAALAVLSTLTDVNYVDTGNSAYEGILRHGVYHRPMNWGVDESVIWGDYFLMETLLAVLTDTRRRH